MINHSRQFKPKENIQEDIYNINDSRISFLRDNLISSMAKGQYDTWANYVNWDEATWLHIINTRCVATTSFPQTFVYLKIYGSNVQYVGSITLKIGCSEIGDTDNLWISGLYVIPEYRKTGISTSLLTHALQEALNRNIAQVYLYTIVKKLDQIYETLGFEVMNQVTVEGYEAKIRMGNANKILCNLVQGAQSTFKR